MSKTFDVAHAQARALTWRRMFVNKPFRHYKGGVYIVVDITVLEATGELMVHYESTTRFVEENAAYRWSRTIDNFLEHVDGKPRFSLISND